MISILRLFGGCSENPMMEPSKSNKNISSEDILEASPDAIITMSRAGEILSWNHSAETLFGYTRADVLGRSIYDLIIPPDQKEETQNAIQAAVMGNPVAYESVRHRRDGSLVTVDISKSFVRSA